MTNATYSRILRVKKYSITEAANSVGVDRATVYRWIQRKLVPAPLTEVIAGVRVTYWTEKELAKVRAHKKSRYWGRGLKRNRSNKDKQEKA